MSVDPVAALKAWAEEDAEGRVMTIVEDPSFADWVPLVLARLSAAEQERDEMRDTVRMHDTQSGTFLKRAKLAEARAEAAEQALLAIAEFYDNGERRVVVSEMKALARAALAPEQSSGYDENLDLRSWWMKQQ